MFYWYSFRHPYMVARQKHVADQQYVIKYISPQCIPSFSILQFNARVWNILNCDDGLCLTQVFLFFCPSSNVLVTHDFSEALSTSFFRQGNHVIQWTLQIVLFSVTGLCVRRRPDQVLSLPQDGSRTGFRIVVFL